MKRRCLTWVARRGLAGSGPSKERWGASTTALHADSHGVGEIFTHEHDVTPPIGVSTTFLHRGEEAHVYSRAAAPTRARCEAVLSAVESRGGVEAEALLYSSGLSAVHAAVSALLSERGQEKTRRRVLLPRPLYHGTREVCDALSRTGAAIEVDTLPDAPDSIGDGDVCWLETPSNPGAALRDIEAYARAAALKGGDVVVDATLAPPPLQYALTKGARLVVHSATKALAGHSDVLCGVVMAKKSDDRILAELRRARAAVGAVPGSLETWLLLRSLRTVDLRVRRQSESAAHLAAWLKKRAGIRAVHHSFGTPLQASQMPLGVGGVFAVELHTEDAAKALPATLDLVKDATSLGGVESLAEWRRRYDADVSPCLVRISVGLEDVDDLVADFDRALTQLGFPPQ